MRISTENDIYDTLARFLDDLPAGFPRTESGVELRILRKLFTPEEARLATHLALIAETPRVIAHRAGIPLEETERLLDSLERKQLVNCFREEGKPATYMAAQFVIGFWEGQVNRLDRELVEDFEEYLPQLFSPDAWGKAPQLRTIPVKQSIPVEHLILQYEKAEAIVQSHTRFAVANCICRQEQRILGHDCGKPIENCLAFDGAADHIERSRGGRKITREEALALLSQAEQTGLVLQPSNDQNPYNICMCCGCCCGVLRSLKVQAEPANLVSSPFVARLNEDLCAGCGACIDRCPMDALEMGNTAIHNPKRCIGCGLCVTTCPTGALELVRKPAEQQSRVPKDIIWLTIRVAQARGKLGPGKIIKIAAKSAVDRLIARK